jgi:predicted nucleotidyltransferase
MSFDDKDTLAICVPPKDYYLGLKEFGSHGTQEVKKDIWDIVIYEAKKAIYLLSQGNPNVLSSLWVDPKYIIKSTPAGDLLIDNRDFFIGKHVYRSFTGYAYSQLHRMEHFVFEGYMGSKRKAIVEKIGYDSKNAAHLIRLLRMGIEFLTDGVLYVEREDAPQLLDIKRGKWTLEQVKTEADRLFKLAEEAYVHSTLPVKPDNEKINELCIRIIETTLSNC